MMRDRAVWISFAVSFFGHCVVLSLLCMLGFNQSSRSGEIILVRILQDEENETVLCKASIVKEKEGTENLGKDLPGHKSLLQLKLEPQAKIIDVNSQGNKRTEFVEAPKDIKEGLRSALQSEAGNGEVSFAEPVTEGVALLTSVREGGPGYRGTGAQGSTGRGISQSNAGGNAIEGGNSSVHDVTSRYKVIIRQRIEDRRRYPPWARKEGIEGNVGLNFVVLSNGLTEDVTIVRSSGYEILDEEAVATIKRATPFPPIPGELQTSRIKIEFSLVFSLR